MKQEKIPKIIHYCWLSGDPFPPKIKSCIDSWQLHLSDYEFKIWDKEAFDIESLLWVKQAFEQKKYAFAADYIRLYALYNYGGIYLDSDVEVLKPFDDLLHLPYFACTEGNNIIEAGAFGAEKGIEWMQECLSYYQDRAFIKEDGSFDTRPLPNIIMGKIRENYQPQTVTRDHFFENIGDYEQKKVFYMMPKEYFCAKDMGTGILMNTEETYCIHHFEMSWMPKGRKFLPDLKRKMIKIVGLDKINFLINFLNLRKLKNILNK